MVCSGKAIDERNREHVVVNLLSNFEWVKSTRKLGLGGEHGDDSPVNYRTYLV